MNEFSYYRLPAITQAYRMTKARRLNSLDWPEWLRYAWELPIDYVGSLHPKESMTATGELEITMPQHTQLVFYDDWIVQDIETGIRCYRPDVFIKLFDKYL
jgi:hypothetical protein